MNGSTNLAVIQLNHEIAIIIIFFSAYSSRNVKKMKWNKYTKGKLTFIEIEIH